MEVPEFFQENYSSQSSAEKHHSFDSSKTNVAGGGDHFIVEELFDFPSEDAVLTDAAAFDNVSGNSTESSTVTVVDSCNSSLNLAGDNGCRNFSDGHFSSDLCVPQDDLAELEWLSNIVEESFSCEDLQKLQLISGMKAQPNESFVTLTNGNNGNSNPIFKPEMAVPAKARSKRSRTAPCNWASRLQLLSPITTSSSSSSDREIIIPTGPPPPPSQGKKSVKATGSKKKDGGNEGNNGEGRKCLHCATDKTPQWRTGPMGPKTLCNACGVRYKSGRLVPEYRPAASPTFVLTKHSNSHRKVLELRRQKDMLRAQQQQQQFMHRHYHQNVMFDLSNGDDYLIHQHVGPEFRATYLIQWVLEYENYGGVFKLVSKFLSKFRDFSNFIFPVGSNSKFSQLFF